MNIGTLMGVAGGLAGGLQPFTLEGQQQQQQIQLNSLLLKQKSMELEQAKAEKEAMIKAWKNQQQAANNPIDSEGNISKGSFSANNAPKELVQQINRLFSEGNELYKIGSPKAFEKFKEAEELQDKITLQQERQFKIQKQQKEEAINQLNGITNQDSYNREILQSIQNGVDPRQVIPGFTGNYEQDKDKIAQVRDSIKTAHEKDMELEKQKSDERAEAAANETKRYHNYVIERNKSLDAMKREKLEKTGKKDTNTPVNQMKYIDKANTAYKIYNSKWEKKNRDLSKAKEAGDKEAQKNIVADMDELTSSYKNQLNGLEALAKASGVKIILTKPNATPEISKEVKQTVEETKKKLIEQFQ